MDCLSLHPNNQWKGKLEHEIKSRDLFLLFWFSHAEHSAWVEWEWRTAMNEKGMESIQLHPLEPNLKPPELLQEVHCSDPLMFVREAKVMRRER